jgi:hypothetical protein
MVRRADKIDTFPFSKILPRWILGAAEIGLSIYFVISFHYYLGLFYGAYWIFSLFVLLPLIRCTKCYYYGKRCNTAWGLLAKFAFPRGETVYFQAGYALTVLLWPLRFFPFAIGLLGLIGGITLEHDGLFGAYIVIILLHRLFYRLANCPVCHQQEICPVYNPEVLMKAETAEKIT